MRVFVSHSSKDKDFFVRPFVENLKKVTGSQQIVFDEMTFEDGTKTVHEIDYWLSKTDLFVLLISDYSLKSEWVQKEILESYKLEENPMFSQRIYPVIIDSNITFADPRIPEWLRAYNIRTNRSPKKLAKSIASRLIEISWELNPNIKNRNTLYVGRNKEMDNFEERIDNLHNVRPNILIASGISSIGRRSFLKNGLVKVGVIKESYEFPSIQLDSHQSIEDFILNIIDSGYTDLTSTNLMKKTIDEKVDILIELLRDVVKQGEIFLVIDDGAIVTYQRKLAPWFVNLSKRLSEDENLNDIVLCIVSKFNPSAEKIYLLKNIFPIAINELNSREIESLIARYSKIINLSESNNNLEYLLNRISGFPEEIFFAVDMLQQKGFGFVQQNPEIFSDFMNEKINIILNEYQGDSTALQIFKVISNFDFISISSLYDILKSDSYHKYVEEFVARQILSLIGVNSEYIVMNTAIRNYFLRQKISIPQEITNNLNSYIKSGFDNGDYADMMYIVQNLIKQNGVDQIPEDKMIPSLYLKTMKDLYDQKNDSDVIQLADRVLKSSAQYLDKNIISEIRYFLCSSLARIKDSRFKSEVQEIHGAQHNFLFGFYYRHIGNFYKSIQYLKEALKDNHKYQQAKRELVRVYNITEEYDKALVLAKENYQGNMHNEYHIQAYFKAVLSSKLEEIPIENKKRLLKQLIQNISVIQSDRAMNMMYSMKAEYYLFIDNNIAEAEKIIAIADREFPKDLYISLFKIDLYERTLNVVGLKEVAAILSNHDNKNDPYYSSLNKCKAYIAALENKSKEAYNYLDKVLLTGNIKSKITENVDYLLNKN